MSAEQKAVERGVWASDQPLEARVLRYGRDATLNIYQVGCLVWQHTWNLN